MYVYSRAQPITGSACSLVNYPLEGQGTQDEAQKCSPSWKVFSETGSFAEGRHRLPRTHSLESGQRHYFTCAFLYPILLPYLKVTICPVINFGRFPLLDTSAWQHHDAETSANLVRDGCCL